MPTYDYICQDCGARFEVRMSMAAYAEGAQRTCERCGSKSVVRAFTTVNVLTASRGGTAGSAACGTGGFT